MNKTGDQNTSILFRLQGNHTFMKRNSYVPLLKQKMG